MPSTGTHREVAYKFIRSRIVDGTLVPGHRVSDIDLAGKIGVSRTPVREAIRRLESEGLIEQVPRYGAYVRRLDRKEIADLYDLRTLIESYAVEQAATRLSKGDLSQLQRIVHRLHEIVRQLRDEGRNARSPEEKREWFALDIGFHMIIVRASGNDQVRKIVADFRVMSRLSGQGYVHPEKTPLQVQSGTWVAHRRILRALRRRDPVAARRAIRKHIEEAKSGVLAAFDRQAKGPVSKTDDPELLEDILEGVASDY